MNMRDRDVKEEKEDPETDTTGDPGGEAQALLTSGKRTALQPTDPTPPPTGPGKDPII
jgi:hypothetical protein